MNAIPFSIPANYGQVFGAVYTSNNPDDLSEDMLDVLLPNGLLVCAGWYPDSDPNGEYVVTLTNCGRQIIRPIHTKSPHTALLAVLDLVDQYRWRSLNLSQSEDISANYPPPTMANVA